MPSLIDPSVEVAVSSLASFVLDVANKHVRGFSNAVQGSVHDWARVSIAPTARYVHDPAHLGGKEPAYVELRMIGPAVVGAPEQTRGYILVSLTEEDYPIPEFSTSGATKTDRVPAVVGAGPIKRFMRFGPGYVVGEDAAGAKLTQLGSAPLTFSGLLPAGPVVEIQSDTFETRQPDRPKINAAAAASYADLKADVQSNPERMRIRKLRAVETAAAWRLARGVRNPPLLVNVGQTQQFLTGKVFASADEVGLRPVEIIRIATLPKGGIQVIGASPGSVLVRLQEQSGAIDSYIITVGAASASDAVVRDAPVSKTYWAAGTGWGGDQRQYNQISNAAWCPLDGCGPTALSMLFGWWDANGVPGVFYRLKSGAGDAHNFRFVYESLRDQDAPISTDGTDNEAIVVPLYNDLYNLSNTICFATTDQGATPPDQLVSAFQEYVGRIVNPLPAPNNEFGQQFVTCYYSAAHVVAPGGATDWKHSGKLLAKGIQDGVPGVTGIGLLAWDLHYPLAYAYVLWQQQNGNELEDVGDYFECNMGWGSGHPPEYHNARDVWFGLSARFHRGSSPTSPNDILAATFNSPDRVDVFTRTAQLGFQRTASPVPKNNGWPEPWNQLPNGTFLSGPAACVTHKFFIKGQLPQTLHVFGRGGDNRIWRARSPDDGSNYDVAWSPMGEGKFNSSPAACVSAEGQSLHVFGRGEDNKIWRAHSSDGGNSWDTLWAPTGEGLFESGPAACISADGTSLHVFGRGKDRRIWRAHSY
ncbi:MAG: hypothetical protein M3R43_09720, partial [Acidobacteriota bacterium]|nr:hypothetical protein [Acidobacteriota bacterium]